MRILVVDNHTRRLPEWKSLLAHYATDDEINIVRAEQLKPAQAAAYDLVILTGATGFGIAKHSAGYAAEFVLIRERTKPLLGVCSGFQAIAAAFGSTLQYRPGGVRGVIDIEVLQPDQVFGEARRFKAYVSHKYFIAEAPKQFTLLAKSIFNVEAIKHESRPIYGFQFHPEVSEPQNDGVAIFSRFMETVVQKQP